MGTIWAPKRQKSNRKSPQQVTVSLVNTRVCGFVACADTKNQILFFIAALGATMDVGMSIASTIQELHERSPQLGTKELFVSGIRVGRDMMGTMANTLIFAYVGGSLSTLVVNYAYNLSYNQLINSYVIGTEIMQGLSGTLGVVLTVPITAAVAAVLIGKKKIVKEPLMQDIYDGSDDYEEPETDGEYGEDV